MDRRFGTHRPFWPSQAWLETNWTPPLRLRFLRTWKAHLEKHSFMHEVVRKHAVVDGVVRVCPLFVFLLLA